jgi:hypothetical protein
VIIQILNKNGCVGFYFFWWVEIVKYDKNTSVRSSKENRQDKMKIFP